MEKKYSAALLAETAQKEAALQREETLREVRGERGERDRERGQRGEI